MNSRKSFLSLFAGATLLASLSVGCGQKDGSNKASSLKVTNGRSIQESEFPSVVLLAFLKGDSQSICTGTFVNDSQVVTAAHCVEGLPNELPNAVYVKDLNGEPQVVAFADSLSQHPDYKFADGVNPRDVAVINFPANTAPAVSPLAPLTPSVGEQLTIVGYGNNENFFTSFPGLNGESSDSQPQQSGSGAGSKRVGTNQIADVSEDGMIGFIGVPGKTEGVEVGDLVASGSGDSGGPLFVNGKLSGVTSGGGLELLKEEDALISISLYVDLNSPSSKSYLNSVLKNSSGVAAR